MLETVQEKEMNAIECEHNVMTYASQSTLMADYAHVISTIK